jgi:hypothetical protein
VKRRIYVHAHELATCAREHTPLVRAIRIRKHRRLHREGVSDGVVVEEVESDVVEETDEAEVFLVEKIFGDVCRR